MTAKTLLLACITALFPLIAYGQDGGGIRAVQIRTVFHDPVSPVATLFVPSAGGALAKVNLAVEGFTDAQVVTVANGSLNFYTTATIDPTNPTANLASTVKVPASMEKIIVLVVPAASKDAKPPYRMMVLDDSAKAFGKGESRVVNLTPVEFALEVGDSKIRIPAANVTPVPRITKLNEFNQAQTNFYYKQGDAWEVFAERQMQYIDTIRRVFLIYTTPGAVQPDIRTIVDYALPMLPKQTGTAAAVVP